MPQIIRYSFVCLPWDSHPVFPYINHPIVQFCISTSHGTRGHPFGTIWDPGGGCLGPLQARQQPKHASNHQIFFCPPSMGLTPNFPTVRSTHSKLLYLDFSWNGRSSIWNYWGTWGGAMGAPTSQKTTKTCLKSPDILLSAFHGTNSQFSHSQIIT